MSMMVSFVLSFFPRDVLDEILNLIESVSEDFPSYSFISNFVIHISQIFVFKMCVWLMSIKSMPLSKKVRKTIE